jgi:SNF2-related domain
MILFDPSRARVPLFKHQIEDVQKMLQIPNLLNGSQMGTAKTATTINAACALYEAKEIHVVVVVAPAQCKSVWLDPDLGELQKHLWVVSNITHYHGPNRRISFDVNFLNWVVCSYEFLRQDQSLKDLIKAIQGWRTMLVCDESIFVSNPKAIQTRHIWELSKQKSCVRKYEMNGTPHGGRIEQTYAQFKILNPNILDLANYGHFKARYCVLGGHNNKQVVAYKNQEDYIRRTSPFVIRHLKKDCLDLPEKLYTFLTVPLTEESWKRYKQMRDEMVAWLGSTACLVQHAPVKALRLSQLCAGFLGGVQDIDPEEWSLYGIDEASQPIVAASSEKRTEVVSTEKLDFTLGWLKQRFEENQQFRVAVWCRFRLELARYQEEIARQFPQIKIVVLQGGQSTEERRATKHEMEIGTGACVMLGNQQAGGFGISGVSIPYVFYASCGYSLIQRLQGEDRFHRSGTKTNVFYTDLLAVGPGGQQTIDAKVHRALRKNEDLLSWTTEEWRKALEEE